MTGISTRHYSTLGPLAAGSEFAAEWDIYREHLPTFLADGREGQVVLIRNATVIGFWDTYSAGLAAAERSYPGERSYLLMPIQEFHPNIRTGYNRLCRE